MFLFFKLSWNYLLVFFYNFYEFSLIFLLFYFIWFCCSALNRRSLNGASRIGNFQMSATDIRRVTSISGSFRTSIRTFATRLHVLICALFKCFFFTFLLLTSHLHITLSFPGGYLIFPHRISFLFAVFQPIPSFFFLFRLLLAGSSIFSSDLIGSSSFSLDLVFSHRISLDLQATRWISSNGLL